jgi:hypothetical protein
LRSPSFSKANGDNFGGVGGFWMVPRGMEAIHAKIGWLLHKKIRNFAETNGCITTVGSL